ncbi:TIM-barrel domain-containing protein [Kocuria aegyptia]|uniref:Glycoside hydrolase family 31 protein n=1 Tax=Kocuria aegyptia TaxID=330943 RepID=A0ABP4WUA8_9MICC
MRLCTRVERIERVGDWICVGTNSIEIRVLLVTDDVVRIRAGFDPDFTEESYTLVTTAWPDRLDEFMGDQRTRLRPAAADLADGPVKAVVTGRRLRIEIEKDPFRICVYDLDGTLLHADVVDLGYLEDSNRRRIHTSEIAGDDRFYGFGETTGPLNKSQKLVTMSPKDAMGYDPRETDPLYKHIPFYIKLGRATRQAVGYFYHNTYDCDFDMGREKSNYWPAHSRYRTDGGDIDLFLIAGPAIRDVVQRYTALTGRSAMLPKTALGYLGSSMYYPELSSDCDKAIAEFMDIAQEQDIPMDGFQLSSGYTQQETSAGLKRCVLTWNEQRFPDPAGFFSDMARRGVTVSPNVKPGVLTVHPDVEELRAEGVFVRNSNGDDWAVGTWWGGKGHFVDFTNPEARAVWKHRLTRDVLDMGTTSVWNDNCEYDGLVDKDARCAFDGNGGTIGRLKAVMPNLMCHVTQEAITEAADDARPFIVCRSGHAGIQRYAQTWAGDNSTSWDSLAHNVATMLGMSLSGVANQGTDIGGFYGPAPEAELLVRWVQHGAFQPRFSIHSVNTDNTVTEPWMYGEVAHLVRDAIQFRYRLFPYLYSLMARAHGTGLPITEPMCSAFQHDPACDEEGVDFMLGDALLVANVVERGASTRRVYLPEGETFYDFATREACAGGQAVDIPVDLSSTPLFIRGGGIVPLASNQMRNLAQEDVMGLRLVCAPDRDGRFTLYEDDGVSRKHENGESLRTEITMTAGEHTVLDFARQGDFRSPVRDLLVDVVHPEKAPFWVSVGDTVLPHHLNAERFERAETGWHYSQSLKSVLIKLPYPSGDFRITVSFEQFDMIGI